jgi:hypothetical protein
MNREIRAPLEASIPVGLLFAVAGVLTVVHKPNVVV